tara:strand:- start:317 stop:490 length:174 start_codon:yes stop_codon:yes gene_type:complete
MSITFKSPDNKWQLNIRNSAGMPTKWFEPKWSKISPEYTTKEIIESMKKICPEAWNE